MFAPVPDQPLYQSEKSPINAHYKQFNIEACDVIDDWKLNFNLGSVIKYIARCDFKDDRLQDLQKAHDYLTREIANEKKFRKEVGV